MFYIRDAIKSYEKCMDIKEDRAEAGRDSPDWERDRLLA